MFNREFKLPLVILVGFVLADDGRPGKMWRFVGLVVTVLSRDLSDAASRTEFKFRGFESGEIGSDGVGEEFKGSDVPALELWGKLEFKGAEEDGETDLAEPQTAVDWEPSGHAGRGL